jgi:hypothetical protein
METVLITWRFQNIVTVALMVILLSFAATAAAQAFRRSKK